jgi:transposase
MGIVPVFVGLDYHDATIRVCILDADGNMLVNKNVPNDHGAVIDLVRLHGGLVRGVAIEACCGAADFASRLLDATEWTVKLAHPGAVNRLKQGPDKTDHGDAWHLADLLRVGYLPEVWLADEQTRQLRRLVRYRAGLAEQKKEVKLRIGAVLREERLVNDSGAKPWTKRWNEWLKTVQAGEQSRWVLDQEITRLKQLETWIDDVDARMKEATKDDKVVAKLMEQVGVGIVTAVILRAVVGQFDRFHTGKQLSRYCGVTPCNSSSGKRQADAGLVETGHDILRPILIQLAKRLPRSDAHWKDIHSHLRKTKGANVASAAIANRWLRRVYHEMVSKAKQQPA